MKVLLYFWGLYIPFLEFSVNHLQHMTITQAEKLVLHAFICQD